MRDAKSDEALISRFVNGRRSALERLARRYEQPLLGLAVGLLNGREDLARDAIQETWVRVIRFAERFEGKSSFKTWIYRIAINQCRSVASTNERQRWAADQDGIDMNTRSSDPPPDARADIAERNDRLRRAVDQLGPDKREIVLLCYHRGLTHEEAAEILDIPLGTLKSRLNAALKELRARLAREMQS